MRKKLLLIPMMLSCCLLLTGCPSGGNSSDFMYRSSGGVKNLGNSYSMQSADYYVGGYESEYRDENTEKQEQMMAYSYDVRLEFRQDEDDIDNAFEQIMDEVYKSDGYLTSKNAQYYSDEEEMKFRYRNGYIYFSVEIPADNAEPFAESLREIGYMTSFSQTIKNLTRAYEKAEYEDDVLMMEDIEHDVLYSDFNITLETVTVYTGMKPSVGNRIKSAFKAAFENFLWWLEEYAVEILFVILEAILIGIPCSLVLGLLLWVCSSCYRYLTRHNGAKGSPVRLSIDSVIEADGSNGFRLNAHVDPPAPSKKKKNKKNKSVTEEKVEKDEATSEFESVSDAETVSETQENES